MVSVGSKALPSRTLRNQDFSDSSFMGREDSSSKQSVNKMGMKRKPKKGASGFYGDDSGKNLSGKVVSVASKSKHEKHHKETDSRTSFFRKQVDPETAKYSSEIANLFESLRLRWKKGLLSVGMRLKKLRAKN